MKLVHILLVTLVFSQLPLPEPETRQGSSTVVEMNNKSEFVPNEITISVGDDVVWKNTSDLVHTVTCQPEEAVDANNVNLPKGAEAFNSGRLSPGGSFKKTFTVKGTYKYFCIPHEATGMVGTVVVK